MELWFVIGVLAYMVGAVASIIDKHMMNQNFNPVTTTLLRTLFNGILLGTVGLLFFNLRLSGSLLMLAAIPALFLAVNFVVFYRVLQRKNASEIIPFFLVFDLLFIFLGSIFFLQEPATWENYVGIAIMLCGMYLVLTERIFTLPRLDRSFLIIAGLIPLDVTSAILIKKFLGNTQPIALSVSVQLMAFLMLAAAFLLMRRRTSPAPSYSKPRARIVLCASLCAATSSILLYTALASANASKVYPLAGVSIVTLFLLATLFLREKFYRHRFVGTLIVLIGIYLISI